MTPLAALWLPILLSAVIVFVASSIIHMASPWHKNDYAKLSNEDQVMGALRPLNIAPGDYLVPRPGSMAEMKEATFVEKVRIGPNMIVTVIPNGPRSMSTSFVTWFVFLIVVAVLAAYLTGRAIPPGAPYMDVFRFTTVSAFLGHAAGLWPQSIWYHRKWSTTAKMSFDGLIYAMLTAGTFGWLWPR